MHRLRLQMLGFDRLCITLLSTGCHFLYKCHYTLYVFFLFFYLLISCRRSSQFLLSQDLKACSVCRSFVLAHFINKMLNFTLVLFV